ncbi:FAD-dependent oxidoreductase [Fibrella sp. HMF5335]|uniref:FAD-dependent oxidoreductase n=1 Tax=Fibrella rubiginis TaxID=2817060 RepID=A0A939GGA9_9BACT|nr:FAD-dependent oxidoreductase [Fibrella rubiginis]MBO0936216.1 FAD-dependent oxidoreductase [Fibrella rubiginis]
MTEIAVAHTNDLADGQLKEVTAGDTKLLLARVGTDVFAVGAVCPHLQAPLAKGLLCGKRLYCPWHHSSFDIGTGHLIEPPSLDGLSTYPAREADGQIWVQLPDNEKAPAEPAMASAKVNSRQSVLILGGGAAGFFAAQTLRERGFSGRISLVLREDHLPYDRTKLSKAYLNGKATADKLPLRNEDFFKDADIDVLLGKEATQVATDTRTISFKDGTTLPYDQLLLATGSTPNTLPVPGADLPGVHTLRSQDDAAQLLDQLKPDARVVIVGASFIGLEVAASLRQRNLPVTITSPEKLPFEKLLGAEIGQMFQRMHEKNGVNFRLGTQIVTIQGQEYVDTILLDNGETMSTDLVIVGIGVKPNTGFLQGLQLNEKDHSISVDEHLRAAEGLYVAGDIARFPGAQNDGTPIRIEHWRTALQQGRTAALNMMGLPESTADYVPFFWTNQYDKRLSYVGHAEDWDDLFIDGSVADQTFLAFYSKAGKVLAVASMNRDQESIAIEELMRIKTMPDAASIRNKLPDFKALVY